MSILKKQYTDNRPPIILNLKATACPHMWCQVPQTLKVVNKMSDFWGKLICYILQIASYPHLRDMHLVRCSYLTTRQTMTPSHSEQSKHRVCLMKLTNTLYCKTGGITVCKPMSLVTVLLTGYNTCWEFPTSLNRRDIEKHLGNQRPTC